MQALLDRQGMVSTHLERLLAERAPEPVEAALATELAHGVVRRQATLDAVVGAYVDRPRRELPAGLRQILRMGVYQILMLDRVPEFAAVNEAVNACRKRFPVQAGFVNAVLRGVARGAGEPRTGEFPFEADTVPVELDRHRRLDRPVFPPPEEHTSYIAQACSLPEDLAAGWLERFGSMQEVYRLAMHANSRPPVVARVNLWKTSVPAVLAELAAAGVEAIAHESGRSIVFQGHVNVAELAAFQQGLITPQDATATEVAGALDVGPGMRVLDFCASPGTKTTHLSELMQGRGLIVAVDVNQDKLERVRQAQQRCGLDIIQALPTKQAGSLEPGSFDRVLVDAPCSNTGVLARRHRARWRFSAEEITRLAHDQAQLLGLSAIFLTPNGKLVYSTCSIEPQENERVVRAFLRQHRKLALLDQKLTLPAGAGDPRTYRDGGYRALLDSR